MPSTLTSGADDPDEPVDPDVAAVARDGSTEVPEPGDDGGGPVVLVVMFAGGVEVVPEGGVVVLPGGRVEVVVPGGVEVVVDGGVVVVFEGVGGVGSGEPTPAASAAGASVWTVGTAQRSAPPTPPPYLSSSRRDTAG